MRLKKAKGTKEVNICMSVFFVPILMLFIHSFFVEGTWDFLVSFFLMLILSFLCVLINTEWEINQTGLSCYVFLGKVKVKEYLWNDFSYIGVLIVLGKGRMPTQEMIVCATKKPYKKYSNSTAYSLNRGKNLCFEKTEDNCKIFMPYYKGSLI